MPTALVPVYELINQVSVDIQGAVGKWLFKLEAMTRDVPGDRFAAAVAGFEYTESGIWGSGADLGLLFEYQYDGREKFSRTMLTNTLPTPNNNDIFVGMRFGFNDEQNSQLCYLVSRSTWILGRLLQVSKVVEGSQTTGKWRLNRWHFLMCHRQTFLSVRAGTIMCRSG
jgi:hypothetical protein